MERIFTELSNPVWWFSVVIAGIAINILSSYLRGALDSFFSEISSSWRNISLARKAAWNERIKRISSVSQERENAYADELRNRLKSIFMFLLTVISFCCALSAGRIFDYIFTDFVEMFFFIFSAFLAIRGVLAWKYSCDIERMLKETIDKASEQCVTEHTDV